MKKHQFLDKKVVFKPGLTQLIGARSKWAAVFCAAVSSGYESSICYAQGAVIEEVQVTARRRVEKDIDVPIAMTVMGEDFLRQQNIGQLTDLGTKVPGLQITSTGPSPNAPIVSIRGQRPNDLLISADPAVPIYFNDVVLTPAEGSNLAMYDLQSVQVLKGPQGTLFGRNSTGGALILTPTRPGDQFGGYLETKLGNYDLVSVEGAVDLPASDILRFRLAGRMIDRDGYQKNVADNELNGERYWDEHSKGARLTMSFDPSDFFRNVLVLGYDENDAVGRAGRLEAFNGSAFVARRMYNSIYNQQGAVDEAVERIASIDNKHHIESDVLPVDAIEVRFASNTTEIDLSDAVTLKSILGYRGVRYSQAVDADGSAFPWLGAVTPAYPLFWLSGPLVTRDPATINTETDQYSAEFQLLGSAFDGSLEWMSGVYGFKMQGTVGGSLSQVVGPRAGYPLGIDFNYTDPDEPIDPKIPWASVANAAGMLQHGVYQSGNNGDLINEALGAFAEATYAFNPQWSWTLGVRYSRDDREVTVKSFAGSGRAVGLYLLEGGFGCSITYEDLRDNIDNVTGNPGSDGKPDRLPNDACFRTVSDRFESPTWRTSVNFTPVDGMLLYGGVSTGYRTGGFNMRGVSNQSLQPFSEETVTSYEIGHKADWSVVGEFPVRTNIAVYYQDYQDIQQTQTFVATDGSTTGGGFDTRIVNAAEAAISGVEFDVTVVATENLTLSLSYAYTRPEFKDFETTVMQNTNATQVTQVTVPSDDSEFPFIPEHALTFAVTYFLPLNPELGDMSVMANAYWQDEVATALDSNLYDRIAEEQGWAAVDLAITKTTAFADDYTLFNLRYDWKGVMQSNFDFALYIDNVTNEEYVVGGLNVMSSLGLNVNTYGPPRTFGASVRYTF